MGPLINVSYYAWRVIYEDNQQRPVMCMNIGDWRYTEQKISSEEKSQRD